MTERADGRGASAQAPEPGLLDAAATPLGALLRLFDLDRVGADSFRGFAPPAGRRIYGGLVIAQALVAAQRCVEGREPHSLHAYFLLPGDPYAPILYDVERLRDGGSFSTRRVVAKQHGRAIFTLAASFQIAEAGLEHMAPPPAVPAPETLPSEAELLARHAERLSEPVRRFLASERPIETRPVDPEGYFRREGGASGLNVWLRASGRLPDDPGVHRAMLAYMSDLTLLDTALMRHGRIVMDPGLQVASLDHALWLHRPFRADEWLLYAQESPNAGGGRGLARGGFYARDGRLVASSVQEGLMRPLKP
ncbi:acyl-CoA thioesterase [Methylocella sp.]|uniref:acyl-CoA thioesterase n=1 Tax=Methylocella sp. TaxID=1978226 RepID=UPI0035ADD97D